MEVWSEDSELCIGGGAAKGAGGESRDLLLVVAYLMVNTLAIRVDGCTGTMTRLEGFNSYFPPPSQKIIIEK